MKTRTDIIEIGQIYNSLVWIRTIATDCGRLRKWTEYEVEIAAIKAVGKEM